MSAKPNTCNWQPIHTAPKETRVLVWVDGQVFIATQEYEQASYEDSYESFWYWDAFDSGECPTHWMPLPEPPKETT